MPVRSYTLIKNCIESGALIMIVKTFKVRKKGLVICGGILIAILAILIVFGVVHKFALKSYSMKTESDRQKFMSDMGWKVSEEYTSCKVVSIPEDFNDTYESYNEIQKDQGFNLKKYRGEMVEIYTYEVYNYPGKSENVVINLMVFEGKLIGGDVSCNELDGFMQGLKNSCSDDEDECDDKESDKVSINNENSDSSDSSETEDSSGTEKKSKKKGKKSSVKSDDESSESAKEESKDTFDSSETEEDNNDLESDTDGNTSDMGGSSDSESEENSTKASTENTSSASENANE